MNTRLEKRRFLNSLLVCVATVFLYVSLAQAQSAGTAALTGTVTDTQGRAVPNTTVTVTNLGTGQERTSVTGTDGVYKFSLLPPANYEVKFNAPGFKTAEVASVALNVTETPTVDQVLQVGTVTQTVTVESSIEELQTESSTLGATVTGSDINSLPLANRNYTEIIALSAGTTGTPMNAASLTKGTQDMAVNGNDPGQNNFQMDGVAINPIANTGSANDNPVGTPIYSGIAIPSPDAIAEFKVQTSTYDASYGRNPGANVNVVTKSGTKEFHGTAFEFLRNSVLNANDFITKADQGPGRNNRGALTQNQFGGTFGGPIRKDKLFFFASYQGTRSKNGVVPQGITTAQMPPIPAGDRNAPGFADALANANCNFSTLLPAFLGVPQLHGPAASCGANQGAENVNPVTLKILQLQGPKSSGGYFIPANDTPGCGPSPLISGFFQCSFVIPAIHNEDQGVGNLDYVINNKNTLSVRSFYSVGPYQISGGGNLPGAETNILYTNANALLKLTTVATNNFVNEARVSYQRLDSEGSADVPPGAADAELGIRAATNPPGPVTGRVPYLAVVQGGIFGIFGLFGDSNSPVNQFQVADQISWSHGRHTLRAGGEYEWTQWNYLATNLVRGFLVFGNWNDFFVGQAGPIGFGNILQCGFCYTSFPQGIPHHYRVPNINGFVADDWKVTPRLTLNLGVRWEFDGYASDAGGNATNIWRSLLSTVANNDVPTCGPPACPGVSANYVGNVLAQNSPYQRTLPTQGVIVGTNNYGLSSHPPYSNFAPRFGFAWQPTTSTKLVVRGGAGIFYDRVGLDRVVHGLEAGMPYAAPTGYQVPNSATLAAPFPVAYGIQIPSYLPRYFDPGCITLGTCGFATGAAFPGSPGSSQLSQAPIDQTVHTPLVRQYNLGVQYEFAPSWVLDVGYVGSSGIDLVDALHDVNQAQIVGPGTAIPSITLSGGTVLTTNTTNNLLGRVLFVGYQPGIGLGTGLQVTSFDGISNYNSVQVTLRHQFSHGLTVQTAYTYSKTLTDLGVGSSANSNPALGLRQQYGPAYFSTPHRFVLNYSYELPIGKGMSGVGGKLLNGWNVSGVTVAQGGTPLTIVDSGLGNAYQNNAGQNPTSRAELCGPVSMIKTPGDITSNFNRYLNASAFAPLGCARPLVPNNGGDPLATAYGDARPGVVTGPGEFNWDIALVKTTNLTEAVTMQFRAETFNTFNHPQFSNPAATALDVNTATFGQITTMAVNPRLIQFGVRFLF